MLYSNISKRFFSPGSRHIGEGDIVVSNAAKARQDLGERCHDKVLAMPANGVLIDVDSILYLYWERGGRGLGVGLFPKAYKDFYQ